MFTYFLYLLDINQYCNEVLKYYNPNEGVSLFLAHLHLLLLMTMKGFRISLKENILPLKENKNKTTNNNTNSY